MIKNLLDKLSLTKDWTLEYDAQSDSILIADASSSKGICYIQIDEYDKNKPLEITDDCNTLYNFNLNYDGEGPEPIGFKHIRLTENQVHAIDHLLNQNKIFRLSSFNEIILDTNFDDINKDLNRYLQTLTLLIDLLNIFKDSQQL